MPPTLYKELRVEQQRLQQEVDTLKKQVNMLLAWCVERDALKGEPQEGHRGRLQRTGLPRPARSLLQQLPEHFTVDDLITLSEEADLDALRAYQDLQLLVAAGYVKQEEDVFFKTHPAG